MRRTVNTDELASRLREKRIREGLTIRKAALAAGVSQPTLTRVLSGRHIPASDNLLLLAQWLGISVELLMTGSDEREEMSQEAPGNDTYMPDAVARLLRADRTLKPEHMKFLILAFQSMYDSVRALANNTVGSKDTEATSHLPSKSLTEEGKKP